MFVQYLMEPVGAPMWGNILLGHIRYLLWFVVFDPPVQTSYNDKILTFLHIQALQL